MSNISKKVDKKCVTCTRMFTVPPSLVRINNCSKVCADTSRRIDPEEKKRRKKIYLSDNKQRISAVVKNWQARNADKVRGYKNKWRQNNPDRTNFLTRRYIYRKKHATGDHSFDELVELKSFSTACAYCNKNKPDTIDHMVPLSRGGSNNVENLMPVCLTCNSKKHAKTLFEWNPGLWLQFNYLSRKI